MNLIYQYYGVLKPDQIQKIQNVLLQGMFFAKETGISSGCLSLWLVCAFTFFTVIYKSGQKPELNTINWRDATHVKMTAAQVVETSVTANITWERGKKGAKKTP